MDQPFVLQFQPLAGLGFGQLAFAAFSIQLLEARRIRMESDERVEQVECDIYRLPVAKAPLPVTNSSSDSPSMNSVMRYQSPTLVLPAQKTSTTLG